MSRLPILRALSFSIWLFGSPNFLMSSATTEVFAKYPNNYFIETGTCFGKGIEQALSADFHIIYSIELSDQLYIYNCKKFANNTRVRLYHGDSGELLKVVLKKIKKPATFWLDGHYSGANTAKSIDSTPILRELNCIKEHYIKNHTILIDDVRLFGTKNFDFISLDTIQSKLWEINPDYVFSFEDGYIEKDILVAKILN